MLTKISDDLWMDLDELVGVYFGPKVCNLRFKNGDEIGRITDDNDKKKLLDILNARDIIKNKSIEELREMYK